MAKTKGSRLSCHFHVGALVDVAVSRNSRENPYVPHIYADFPLQVTVLSAMGDECAIATKVLPK